MKASKVHGNKIIVSEAQKAFIRDNFLTMPLPGAEAKQDRGAEK